MKPRSLTWGVRGQRGDQADVGALGRLDRTDAAVVGTVHVADIEAGALARQAARPERRDAPLVPQLGERVHLVLELRQLAAAEELAQRCHDRPVVDQLLRGGGVGVAEQHTLAHAARHAAEADADLVGDQLTDGADAPVAEVVDVVLDVAVGASLEVDQVLDGRHQAVVDEGAVVEAEQGVDLELEVELAVDLVASGVAEVVAARVGEQAEQVAGRLVDLGGVAGTEDGEEPQQRLVGGDAGRALALEGRVDQRLVAGEQFADLLVAVAEDAQQEGERELALVHLHPQDAAVVELDLDPGAALRHRDDAGGETAVGAAQAAREVDAGAAVDLRDDHPVGAVDHERAVLGHQRQVAEEDLVLLDQPGVLVDQLQLGEEAGVVREVLLPALLGGVLRLFEGVLEEVEDQPGLPSALGLVDREDLAERGLQSDALAQARGGVPLHERFV